MTRVPMRPPATATVSGVGQNEERPSAPQAEPAPRADAPLSRRAGTRQLNLRLLLAVHERYRRLLRDCEEADFETSLTELVHALLYEGPKEPGEARQLVRRWRQALDHEA